MSALKTGRPGAWALASSLVLALLVAPLAIGQDDDVQGRAAAGEGEAILGGDRNPQGGDANRYEVETEIIANTGQNTYGTRQSNLGEGGGAIYGCRSTTTSADLTDPEANTPCVRINNLNDGLAFQIRSGGNLGGVFDVGDGGDAARPFVTNATGVATGLNADRVDGLDAEQIIAQAQQGGGDGTPGAGGATGPAGPAGPAGEDGDPGAPGMQGEQGEQGETGMQGPSGSPGADGMDGAPGIGAITIRRAIEFGAANSDKRATVQCAEGEIAISGGGRVGSAADGNALIETIPVDGQGNPQFTATGGPDVGWRAQARFGASGSTVTVFAVCAQFGAAG